MTYRCNVEPGSVGAGGLSLQLYCIRELARMGGHASCSVKRQNQAACDGEPRTLVFGADTAPDDAAAAAATGAGTDAGTGAAPTGPGGGSIAGTQNQPADPPAITPPAQSPPIPAQPAAASDQHDDSQPPNTVEDLAKHAARSSKKQLDKAGRAVVGGVKSAGKTVNKAAKSTWRCLSSFFTDC